MKFFGADCVICGQPICNQDRLIPFRRRPANTIGRVEVERGQQPYAGVRCACFDCVLLLDKFRREQILALALFPPTERNDR